MKRQRNSDNTASADCEIQSPERGRGLAFRPEVRKCHLYF